jgi:DNA-binding response OmpR family regulator
LSITLELEGYKVQWTKNLADAAKARKQQEYSLIILDLGLPDGDGLTFLKELRKAGDLIPVLILTAKTDEDAVVEGLQAGANDYVRKPFGNKELLARIKTVLRQQQNQGQTLTQGLQMGDLAISVDRRKVSRILGRGQDGGKSERLSVGLGSVITKTVAELHRGTVSVSNNPESGGARVLIRLPIPDDSAS